MMRTRVERGGVWRMDFAGSANGASGERENPRGVVLGQGADSGFGEAAPPHAGARR